MMTINSTFIIQICNFLIAYVLFDRILLRALVRTMQEEDVRHEHLKSLIVTVHEAIRTQEHILQREWSEWRLRFVAQRPQLVLQHSHAPTVSVTPVSVDVKEMKKLVSQLADYMVQEAERECIIK